MEKRRSSVDALDLLISRRYLSQGVSNSIMLTLDDLHDNHHQHQQSATIEKIIVMTAAVHSNAAVPNSRTSQFFYYQPRQ